MHGWGIRVFAALWISLGTACSADAGSGKTQEAAPAPGPAGPEAVLGGYLKIQTTLADDKLDELDKLSAGVITAAAGLEGKPGVDTLVTGAGRAAAQDIATARAGFQKMSHGLIEYAASYPDLKKGHEVIFCPMAFNNKGAHWVQKSGDIINPYHGKMMLHCGDRVGWDDARAAIAKKK